MGSRKTVSIGDLGRIVGGATPSTKIRENWDGDIPWLSPKDLANYNQRYISRGERNITQQGYESCSTKILPTGTVLFSSRAPIGYIAIAKNPVCTNQGFKSIIPNDEIDSLFLYYLLKANKDRIESSGSGTTFKELSGKTFSAIEVSIPTSKDEQTAIAHILGSLDNKIELNNQINDYLEEFVVAMFGEFYVSKWGNELPEGWSYQQVDNIAEKVAMGPFGSNIKVDTFVDEGVSIISGAHLKGLLLEESDYNHITEEHANRLNNSMVYPGDIVFTHAGNIGQASLITEWSNEPKYIISQRQFYLRCDKSKLLPEIPALYFHTRMGKHVLTANSTSTGVPSIAQPSSYLKSIELLVPDMPSQQRFVKTTKPLFHSIVANRNEIDCLGRLRDLLLPKLMSGEIDVSQVELPTQLNNHLFDC